MKKQNKRLIDSNSHKAMETHKISQRKPKTFHWLFSLILIMLTGLIARESVAQQFPVRATTVVTPPYSIYLSDYSSPESNSLQLILQLRDLDRPEYRAKLRLTIEGQGITIRTRPGYTPNPIILQGGIPETLTGFDLRGYLNPDNLDFNGISKSEFIRSGSLPEGFYTFTIEVLDFNRNVVVSNQAMANAWLILNDPPLVNLPFNGEKVRATDPQNILFSWTPRHTASPNAAFNTEYEFTLVELFPTGRNPNDAILTSNPIFQTITSATSLNYSVAEPILIPGRQYAFAIRAFDIGGRDLFKNNGRSEVFVFQFGDECLAPTNLEASGLDPNRIEVTWEGQEIHTEFDVRYRKEGTSEWFSENTFSNKQIVPELEGNTTYEYQIRGKCSTIVGPYSASNTIKTPEVDENEFACGTDIPEVTLDNTPLNLQLKTDDEIETGDFKITITDVEANSDGSYKGMGIAQVPYLEFASIRVKFDAIKVNAAYRVFEGNITSVYDANSKFILDADLTGDELNQDGDDADGDGGSGDDVVIPNPSDEFFENYDFEDTVTIDQPILDVVVNDDGDIVITYEDEDGNIKEEVVDPEDGEDTLITDSDGNSWGVDENGNVTANPTNAPSPIESIDEVDYIVTFKASSNQQYGFDNKTYNAGQYEQADIYGSDDPYWIGWKSVALGRQDQLLAITEKNNFPTEVGFKSAQGPGASQPSDKANEKVLTVTGKAADAVETIDAYVNIASDDSSQELILGKINVKTYTNIRKNLIIVPVNDASVPNESTLEEELNKIYGQAVAEWDITIQDRYEVSIDQIKGIADGQAGIFASFPPRMQQFNSDYRLSQTAFDQN
ncbi:MAG: fibronectin type III domain-containing protein, partial [Bacteroidota bacterium]